MSQIIAPENTSEFLMSILGNIGLNFRNAKVAIHDYGFQDTIQFEYTVDFDKIQLQTMTNKPLVHIVQTLESKILGSPLVKSELAHLETQLKLAKDDIKMLQDELQELKQFKTHYDLEMKLRHGNV